MPVDLDYHVNLFNGVPKRAEVDGSIVNLVEEYDDGVYYIKSHDSLSIFSEQDARELDIRTNVEKLVRYSNQTDKTREFEELLNAIATRVEFVHAVLLQAFSKNDLSLFQKLFSNQQIATKFYKERHKYVPQLAKESSVPIYNYIISVIRDNRTNLIPKFNLEDMPEEQQVNVARLIAEDENKSWSRELRRLQVDSLCAAAEAGNLAMITALYSQIELYSQAPLWLPHSLYDFEISRFVMAALTSKSVAVISFALSKPEIVDYLPQISPYAIAECIAAIEDSAAITALFGILKTELDSLIMDGETNTYREENAQKIIKSLVANICKTDNVSALNTILQLYATSSASKVHFMECIKHAGAAYAVRNGSYRVFGHLLQNPEIFEYVRSTSGSGLLYIFCSSDRTPTLNDERIIQLLFKPQFLAAMYSRLEAQRREQGDFYVENPEDLYLDIYQSFMLPDNAELPENPQFSWIMYLRVLLAQIKYCNQEQLSKYASKFAEIIPLLAKQPRHSHESCQIFEAYLEDANFIQVLAGLDDANLNSTIKMLHKAHNPEKILNALIEAEKRYSKDMDTARCTKVIVEFLTTECTDKNYKGLRFGELPGVIECLARNAQSEAVKLAIAGLSDAVPGQFQMPLDVQLQLHEKSQLNLQLQLQIINALQKQIDADVSLRTPELLKLISDTVSHIDVAEFGLNELHDLDKKTIKLDWNVINKWIKLNVTSTTWDPTIVELAEDIHNWQAKQMQTLVEAYSVSNDPVLLKILEAARYKQQGLAETFAAPKPNNVKLMTALWEQLREKNKQQPDSNKKPSPDKATR